MNKLILFLVASFALTPPAMAGSLISVSPEQYDFADLDSFPEDCGKGEFTYELWIKPDNRFPVGNTWPGSKDQMFHWSDARPKPYSNSGWWALGTCAL